MRYDAITISQTVSQADSDSSIEFTQLVRLHHRQVMRVALRLTGSLEDAEDVSQEVFLRLHRSLSGLHDTNLNHWLYRVTANACFDLGRKKKRWSIAGAFNEEIHAPCEKSPEHLVADEEHRALVEQALQHLGERERTALVLREMEELTTAEVAEVLGTSEATVRVQIASARLKLRKLVGFLREKK